MDVPIAPCPLFSCAWTDNAESNIVIHACGGRQYASFYRSIDVGDMWRTVNSAKFVPQCEVKYGTYKILYFLRDNLLDDTSVDDLVASIPGEVSSFRDLPYIYNAIQVMVATDGRIVAKGWCGETSYVKTIKGESRGSSISELDDLLVRTLGGESAVTAHGASNEACSTGTISIDVTPDSGQWGLFGPAGFNPINGTGDRTGGSAITDVPVGLYTLLCHDNVPEYDASPAPSMTLNAGSTITFDVSWSEEREFTEETITLQGEVPLKMIWIPGGTFMMGRYPGEQAGYFNQDPQHEVAVKGFWMAKYELTKRQWEAVMGNRPWAGQPSVLNEPDSPAVYVSWDHARAFIEALNAYTDKNFRLPSEAEWEYACRAGTTTRFYWGDDPDCVAGDAYCWWTYNVREVGKSYAHIVGQKIPNAFGLYDMSGNVMEWCEDDMHDSHRGAPVDGSAWIDSPRAFNRVLRGGAWYYYGQFCRSAERYPAFKASMDDDIGFRIVCPSAGK